jgi:predicted DNA-binding transcriptional regulator AlpA
MSVVYLRAKQLRERYSCSYFWIDYRLANDPTFPKPIYLGRFRHWKLSDLVKWEEAQAKRGRAA